LYCDIRSTTQILMSSAFVDIGQLTTLKFLILTTLFSILSIPTHPIPIIPLSTSFLKELFI